MRKFTFIVLSFISGVLMLTSCIEGFYNSISGNGNVETEKRTVEPFTAIEASTGLNVYLKFGEPSEEIEVVADENLHEYIQTEVHGGVLEIKSSRSIRSARSKDVYVSAGSLKEIRASSAAHVQGENKMNAGDLRLEVSSAAMIDLEINAKSVNIEVSSSGQINLSGKTEHLSGSASSAAHINADQMEAESCELDASSAGQINITVTKELSASASSAGSIRYMGNPEIKRLDTSSAGSVSKK